MTYKLRLLKRATKPVLIFRLARWSFQVTRAKQLDNVQRRMLCIIMDRRLADGQDLVSFTRRRSRAVTRLQAKMGKWSQVWGTSVMSWDEHLKRPLNSKTWAAQLAAVRAPQELQQRR